MLDRLMPHPGGLVDKVIQAAWLDGFRTGAAVTAIALIVLYLLGNRR